MQLIIGGAYSGKRNTVRALQTEKLSWISAYYEHNLIDWKLYWKKDTTLVLEGWEQWIMDAITLEQDDDTIRQSLYSFLVEMKEEEGKRGKGIVLIMLEMGRGIVPVEKKERRLRDLAGWISQDAAKLADEVYYVWHGMKEQLK